MASSFCFRRHLERVREQMTCDCLSKLRRRMTSPKSFTPACRVKTAEVVRRVSSRGLVALIARHDEMNRDVAAACKAEGRILKPDEISFVAREIDKEVEARRAEKSVGSTR
jgi:aspartate aminotransferase-like enzyme